jgi:hypothetical protein
MFRCARVKPGIVGGPGGERILGVDAGGREDCLPQFGERPILRLVGKHCLGPGGSRIGHDVPVDVETGDQFQGGPIGGGAGTVGARHLRRILPGKEGGILARDGEARGPATKGGRHAVEEPVRRLVEAFVRRMPEAHQRCLLVRKERGDESGAGAIGVLRDAAHEVERLD